MLQDFNKQDPGIQYRQDAPNYSAANKVEVRPSIRAMLDRLTDQQMKLREQIEIAHNALTPLDGGEQSEMSGTMPGREPGNIIEFLMEMESRTRHMQGRMESLIGRMQISI